MKESTSDQLRHAKTMGLAYYSIAFNSKKMILELLVKKEYERALDVLNPEERESIMKEVRFQVSMYL